MHHRFRLILLMAFSIGTAHALDTQTNELQKLYGGPFSDIPAASQERAYKYIEGWMQGFADPDSTASLEEIYKNNLQPLIHPLREGNASEQKINAASEEIYKALKYIKTNKGVWNDEELNRLLGIDANTTSDPIKISVGISGLFSAFIHIAAPSRSAEFDKKYPIKDNTK